MSGFDYFVQLLRSCVYVHMSYPDSNCKGKTSDGIIPQYNVSADRHFISVFNMYYFRKTEFLLGMSGVFIYYSAKCSMDYGGIFQTGSSCTGGEQRRLMDVLPGTLWRIIFPIAAPGVFTTAIMTFISAWNEYLLSCHEQ